MMSSRKILLNYHIMSFRISSFGVKAILRRDTVAFDRWFDNSSEIVECLTLRGDCRMDYIHVGSKIVDEVRQKPEGKQIPKCMSGHLFVYKSNSDDVLMREYLCACENCIELKFEDCYVYGKGVDKNIIDDEINHKISEEANDCALDEDYENIDRMSELFEFVSLSSYAALIAGSTTEPIYIVKIVEKARASEKIHDKYGHVVFPGELYLKGKYLVKTRSKNIKKKQFKILEESVLISPDELFEHFLDISDDLTMDNNSTYNKRVGRALL